MDWKQSGGNKETDSASDTDENSNDTEMERISKGTRFFGFLFISFPLNFFISYKRRECVK